MKTGDTYPPLQGSATNAKGELLPLADADKLELTLKSATRIIQGEAKAIDPPIPNPEDPEGPELNWEYEWAADDTTETDDDDVEIAHGLYEGELRVVWDEAADPPAVETLDESDNPTVEIKKALAAK
jgi:hypothetical protein